MHPREDGPEDSPSLIQVRIRTKSLHALHRQQRQYDGRCGGMIATILIGLRGLAGLKWLSSRNLPD